MDKRSSAPDAASLVVSISRFPHMIVLEVGVAIIQAHIIIWIMIIV